jgi:hypothetical protein
MNFGSSTEFLRIFKLINKLEIGKDLKLLGQKQPTTSSPVDQRPALLTRPKDVAGPLCWPSPATEMAWLA